MNTIEEIEDAIKKLPPPQVEELASWLESLQPTPESPSVENWLRQSRGAAIAGATTAKLMAQSRGE